MNRQFFSDMALDNPKAQRQVKWVLKDEKNFNKELERIAGAKSSRHTSKGCILKLI
jgi:hypothetical protein